MERGRGAPHHWVPHQHALAAQLLQLVDEVAGGLGLAAPSAHLGPPAALHVG